MRQSWPLLLTPMSTNCGSSTTRQKLSRTAFIAASASLGPDRLMACTFTIGYAARASDCCKSPTLEAGNTSRVSLVSGGSSWEPWSPQRCTWLRYWLICWTN
ncbi:hypothetical protein PFLmoz3_03834 [Pseudomonas fluorescens]|uniref:Uncharacterized protein n=1 Tax=Pseudomonas fluorescens TaxID=294 RepID=A0A109LFA2_PSEFL|nr:hypothetical protein PFLmoz3_03834 [Pseudomonas fluorescens]